MNADQFIKMLGQPAESDTVKEFLSACGVQKPPKLKRGDIEIAIPNENIGIDITFRDERYLDVKSNAYDDGTLVLSSINMYGDGNESYKKFNGELPLGLAFSRSRAQALNHIGKKPSWKNADFTLARWDLDGYCLFLSFDKKGQRLTEVAVQLPIE